MSKESLKLELVTDDFRVLPIPGVNSNKSKLGTCFVSIEQLPEDLREWMGVNPRTPKTTKKEQLSGQVARSIVTTLEQEPEKFAIKNLGIYLLVESMDSERIKGDKHNLTLTLTDKNIHGVANGGHTYRGIRQVLNNDEIEPGQAFVRLHIYQGVPENQIVDLAEGLNRNLQVQDKSLANLQNKFDDVFSAMEGKKGAEEIAYKEGDEGRVDIQEVLHMMCLMDLSCYPDSSNQPHDLFGKKSAVLKRYLSDIDKTDSESSFNKLTPAVHEILELSEKIQQACMSTEYNLGRYKVKEADAKNRVGSQRRDAYFIDGEVGTLFPQGWLYPMLAAFRANLSKQAWDEGRFEWLVDIDELLNSVVDKITKIILEVHKDQKQKPGEVGRKLPAYEMCYGAVFMELAMKGKIELSA